MGLYQKLDEDLKAAMVGQDRQRVSVLRFLKSELKYVIIEKKQETLSDAEVLQIIQKQIKRRRESVEQFRNAQRNDLAEQEAGEIGILEALLPKQLDPDRVRQLVEECVQKEGAASKKDFGRVMKRLSIELAGQADAKIISDALSQILK